jgi:predicted small metal-binding protein
MKEFACGSVVPGCSAVFVGPTDDAILSQVARHAREDHGMTEVPDEVVLAVRRNIHAVAA